MLAVLVWCSLRNITIPAGFITKSDGQILKDLMDSSKGEAQETFIVMDWNDVLPRASKVGAPPYRAPKPHEISWFFSMDFGNTLAVLANLRFPRVLDRPACVCVPLVANVQAEQGCLLLSFPGSVKLPCMHLYAVALLSVEVLMHSSLAVWWHLQPELRNGCVFFRPHAAHVHLRGLG